MTLAVPDVVIDEATNHFRERLTKATTTLRESHKNLHLLVPDSVEISELPVIEREAVRYREFLLQLISGVGGQTLSYPEIPHQTIVTRDLQRRKPFKENGSGYRDLLIWESLRRLTWSGHERIAFVTANVRDFIADASLHKDLAADILNPGRIEVFDSLRAFNEKHVVPRLETIDRLNKEIQTLAGSSPDLTAWARDNLLEILRWEELAYSIGPMVDVGSFYASEIVAFDDFKITSARKSDDGAILCSLVVHASVDVNVDIDEDDYRNHEEVREWLGGASSGSWHEIFPLAVYLELIIDPTESRVISWEVINVERAEID